MDLQQIKLQLDDRVMISKLTWGKVLDAALYMQSALEDVDNTHHAAICLKVLERVEEM